MDSTTKLPWTESSLSPDSFDDPFVTLDRSSSSNSRSLRPMISPDAPKALHDLTQKEVDALRSMRASMSAAKLGGGLTGAAVALYFSRRRKPPLHPLATVLSTVFGAGIGYMSLLPFVFLSAKRQLAQVEDPKHMKQVLASAVEEMRGSSSLGRRASSVGGQTTGKEAPIGSASSKKSSSSDVNSEAFSNDNAADTSYEGASRWDQLRNKKPQTTSSWERIRQQNSASLAAPSQAPMDFRVAASTQNGSDDRAAATPWK